MVINHLLTGMILQVGHCKYIMPSIELNPLEPRQKKKRKGDMSHEILIGSAWEIRKNVIPIPSMYGIYTYIWLIFMVNVGKYTIHGCYGIAYEINHDISMATPWKTNECPLRINGWKMVASS